MTRRPGFPSERRQHAHDRAWVHHPSEDQREELLTLIRDLCLLSLGGTTGAVQFVPLSLLRSLALPDVCQVPFRGG